MNRAPAFPFAARSRIMPLMALQIRRVVTGHDARGRAVVLSDGVLTHVISRRPAHEAAVVWTTQGHPVSNDGYDPATREIGSTIRDGTVFRIVSYGPGCAPRRHRTDSIDYAVVMSGEIDMELDGGEAVHLWAGDVLVQRGTIHNWVNNGSEPCIIAFVLIDAKPVEAGGQVLNATG
jgi:quercetin dioxygenase-like cupin family protein